MELDLRGLSVEERKKLLKWYLEHAPLFGWKGNLKAFRFLKTLEGKVDERFIKRAIGSLFDECDEIDEEDEEQGPTALPEGKQILGYS